MISSSLRHGRQKALFALHTLATYHCIERSDISYLCLLILLYLSLWYLHAPLTWRSNPVTNKLMIYSRMLFSIYEPIWMQLIFCWTDKALLKWIKVHNTTTTKSGQHEQFDKRPVALLIIAGLLNLTWLSGLGDGGVGYRPNLYRIGEISPCFQNSLEKQSRAHSIIICRSCCGLLRGDVPFACAITSERQVT